MVNPYTQFLPDDQRNAMIGAMRSAPPASAPSQPVASTMPVGQPVKFDPSQTSEGPGGISGRNGTPGYVPIPNPGGQYTPPQANVDTSKWDTNGYAAPGHSPTGGQWRPQGYDDAKWNDTNHVSPKYVIGRILSNYDPSQGLGAAMADIQKAYPGAKQTGDDTISIPGVSNSIDVKLSPEHGGGWWYNDEVGGGPQNTPDRTTMPLPGTGSIGGPQIGGDTTFWQHLMDSLKNAPQLANGAQPADGAPPNMTPEQTQALFNLLNQPKDPNQLMHAMSVAPSGASMASLLKG